MTPPRNGRARGRGIARIPGCGLTCDARAFRGVEALAGCACREPVPATSERR